MKKLVILISLILVSMFSYSQPWAWSPIYIGETTENLKSACFYYFHGSENGYVVGTNGTIFKSYNNGLNI